MKKLIKFDIIHPREWLTAKKAELPDLEGMSLEAYREWLISLASNYSDFYTHYLNESGNWEAEEFFLLDSDYIWKAAVSMWGRVKAGLLRRTILWSTRLTKNRSHWTEYVVRHYLQRFQPDVIFVRSQPLNSRFWQSFRPQAKIVGRLSARLPRNWHPNDFDLLYTDQPDFKHFFELHGVPTILNDQGFDERVARRLRRNPPTDTIVFIGGLGTQNFLGRTEFLERVAGRVDLDWWGYWWQSGGDGRGLPDFPALRASFRGPTSGMEMYQTYADAAICLNDYVDTANGIGFNQRMFEVMGAGGFLLTRSAPNFADTFPAGIFAIYTDYEDCQKKIDYYLRRPEEREAIARRGQEFILKNYNYHRIATEFSEDLIKLLEQDESTTRSAG